MCLASRAVLLLVLTFTLACQAGPQADRGASPPSFKVALVTPGPISDAGWNAAAFAGLRHIESELGADIAHQEVANPAQFEESFRDFAEQGFDLVIGHGFELQDAAATVGAEFPSTKFVITSGLYTADNVAGLVFRLEEAAYLAGVLAGSLSESGVVGTVGGMEIPPVRLVFDGFTRGFRDTRPEGRVKQVFLGNWEDVAAARQATLALIDQGVDLVIHNADAAGLGVFQACRERGVLAFGTNSDQAPVAPEVVLASAVMDIPEALLQVATDVQQGRFIGKVYIFDLASGVVLLAINPALKDRLTPQAQVALDAARTDILRGVVTLEHFGED